MRYLNTKEAAEILGCSRKTVQKRIASGDLVPINPYHSKGYLFEKPLIDQLSKAKEGLQYV